MNKDINDACVDSSYQFDDFLDDNILSIDHSRNFLAPAMRLSCYEEEVVSLQPLTVDIRNKLSLLTYGHFHSFICSIFGQGFYLQAENEVEDNLRACGKLVSQNKDEYLKQEQVYGQKKVALDAKEVQSNLRACP